MGFHQEPYSDILKWRSGPGILELAWRDHWAAADPKPLGGASAKKQGCFVGSTVTANWLARREETAC